MKLFEVDSDSVSFNFNCFFGLNYCPGKKIKENKTGRKDEHAKIVNEFIWPKVITLQKKPC